MATSSNMGPSREVRARYALSVTEGTLLNVQLCFQCFAMVPIPGFKVHRIGVQAFVRELIETAKE